MCYTDKKTDFAQRDLQIDLANPHYWCTFNISARYNHVKGNERF